MHNTLSIGMETSKYSLLYQTLHLLSEYRCILEVINFMFNIDYTMILYNADRTETTAWAEDQFSRIDLLKVYSDNKILNTLPMCLVYDKRVSNQLYEYLPLLAKVNIFPKDGYTPKDTIESITDYISLREEYEGSGLVML